LADALKERFAIDSTLIPGSGGVFDVFHDGSLIYSKQKTGRFPEHHEIIATLANGK
jgi:selT/selW/selH-like putative selenoprotein